MKKLSLHESDISVSTVVYASLIYIGSVQFGLWRQECVLLGLSEKEATAIEDIAKTFDMLQTTEAGLAVSLLKGANVPDSLLAKTYKTLIKNFYSACSFLHVDPEELINSWDFKLDMIKSGGSIRCFNHSLQASLD